MMNNFLFLEAVILGIDGASCLRLKWTRARLPPEVTRLMEEIIELMTMQASFKVDRNADTETDIVHTDTDTDPCTELN